MSGSKIKVMLVDDEYLVRERLLRSISWETHGMEIVAEAGSSLEALEIIDEVVPDIIFADICMPFMDGIELSGLVLKKYPQIKIIILTGHEEFEYAKRSIRIGIEDFISKPVNVAEINEALRKVKSRIEQERLFQDHYEEIKKNLEENMPYLKEKFLNQLVLSNVTQGEIKKKLDFFQMQMPQNHFQVALLELTDGCDGTETEEKLLVLSLKGMDLIDNYLKAYEHIFRFIDNSGRIALLNNNESTNMEDLCEALRNMLISCLQCNVSIGVGNSYSETSSVQLSYKEALNALEYKVVEGENQVICYNDIGVSSDHYISIKNSDLDNLAFYMRAEMVDKAIEMVSMLFDFQSCKASVVKGEIRVISSTVISLILSVITSMDINQDEVFEPGRNPYDYIFKAGNLPDMKTYLQDKVIKVINLIRKVKADETSKAMEMILKYVSDNIHKSDLSLKGLANEFYMNYSYLSRKFKQKTGSTFSEYVMKLRMSMAEKIIRETDKKAYQVAEMIGIPDPHYFNICFKKYTNLSISDFRRIHCR